MYNQIDGHENEEHFIIRLYTDPFSVWVYWPNLGKVEFYLNSLEEARALFEALKPIRERFSKFSE